MPRRPGPRKYDPLAAYLAGLAADRVVLSFAEIAAILGTALPPSARTPRFWLNAASRSPQARAWRRVGWRVAASNVGLGTVTFARDRPDSTG
jgi:hypothetical protein